MDIAVHIRNVDQSIIIADYINDLGFKPRNDLYRDYKEVFQSIAVQRNDIKNGIFVVHLTESIKSIKFSNTEYMKSEEFGKELYTKLITFEEFKQQYLIETYLKSNHKNLYFIEGCYVYCLKFGKNFEEVLDKLMNNDLNDELEDLIDKFTFDIMKTTIFKDPKYLKNLSISDYNKCVEFIQNYNGKQK